MKGKVAANMERVDLAVEVSCHRAAAGKSEPGREPGKCIPPYLPDFDDGCHCKRKPHVHKLLSTILTDLALPNQGIVPARWKSESSKRHKKQAIVRV